MVLRLIIKIAQRLCRQLGLPGFSRYAEMFAAPGDGDIQCGFNLLEILIQCAAQIGETLVVGGCKRNFQGCRFQSWLLQLR